MSSIAPQILNAWFSQQQKSHQGPQPYNNKDKKYPISNIYLTEDGKEIEITEVNKKMTNHGERFVDSKYLGTVVKWVRSIYY